ncbi:MAG: molybdopterin-binding protein [Armatimonadota bacterium]|nr:molybdopterin-binding protein [Armatimonadota bacterium]
MIVAVRLYATLREMVPGGRAALQIEVPDGTTVGELVARLGIPAGTVRKVFVAGIARDDSHVLRPGDEVGIFPPIAGGAPLQEFLHIRSVAEARARLQAAWTPPPPRVDTVALAESQGRVLAADVMAPEDLPPYPRSVVDGFAVRATDTFGASEALPAYLAVIGEVLMGRALGTSLGAGQVVRISTGGVLPPGADAVVMVEHTETLAAGASPGVGAEAGIEVRRPVGPGENVIQVGEDVRRGAVALRAGTVLGPSHIGLLAGLGVTRVAVAAPPRVAVISTGDEVVPPDQTPPPGCIRDINGPALCAAVEAEGGTPAFYGIVRDEFDVVRTALDSARGASDLVLISGGSSIGLRDEVARAIDALGPPGVIVHGVAMKPGKPTVIGLCGQVPIVGLPGHPTTVLVVFHVFVREMIGRLLGRQPWPLPVVKARLGRRIASSAGRADYLRVRLESRGDELWAVPILGKSGLISTMVGADGLAVIPEAAEGVEVGEEVAVEVFAR